MSTLQRFTQVDAFTDRPFTGNPAAVCLLNGPRPAEWMQQVAREMNLAETAFLVRRGQDFDLRWFTPSIEVDLCGHATLASAHVLWEEGHLNIGSVARFHTRSGMLSAQQRDGVIWLDFPSTPADSADLPAELSATLQRPIRYAGRTLFDYLIELESERDVRSLRPDMGVLAKLESRGLIVTARSSNSEYDFVSRFFAPGAGVPEDPVTGSAHCGLGPFWASRLGKRELVGYQASPRGGTVRVRVADDRVHLGGQAVTVLRGELLH